MSWLSNILGGKKKVTPVHLTDANFKAEVQDSQLPVIVDVWSAGCGPCKQLEEVVFAIASEYDGRVKVCELGTHLAEQSAARLRITATPTVLFFRDGKEVERVLGFRGSLYFRQAIAEVFQIGDEK